MYSLNVPVDINQKAASKIGHFLEERTERHISGLLKVDDFVVNKNEDNSDQNAVKCINL